MGSGLGLVSALGASFFEASFLGAAAAAGFLAGAGCAADFGLTSFFFSSGLAFVFSLLSLLSVDFTSFFFDSLDLALLLESSELSLDLLFFLSSLEDFFSLLFLSSSLFFCFILSSILSLPSAKSEEAKTVF